jgi:small subunit ribosomal protein S17
MSKSSNEGQQNIKKGKVLSKPGTKTIKVQVETRKKHKHYHKVIKKTWTTMVHDENEEANVGDNITFKLCRPISKCKKYILVTKSKVNTEPEPEADTESEQDTDTEQDTEQDTHTEQDANTEVEV